MSRLPVYRAQGIPRNVDRQGLTPFDHTDLKILYNDNDEVQRIIHTKISYRDHNGHEKLVVGAVYEVVHRMLSSRLPPLLPPPSEPAYVIRDAPGKGKGVFATRNIAEGEIVIVERPIVIHPLVMIPVYGYVSLRKYAKETLDVQDWNKLDDLLNLMKGDDSVPEFMGVVTTNAFAITLKKGKESYGGIFLEQSRINHSCGPNLTGNWDSRLFVRTVQAVRPIRAGQELSISYADLDDTHADRRYDLQRKYKFQCACGYCTKTSPTSDADRSIRQGGIVVRELEKKYNRLLWSNYSRSANHDSAKKFINDLVKELVLLRKEGIESMAGMWTYLYLMKTYGLCGDEEMFKKWGFKAVLLSCTFFSGEKGFSEVEKWINWIKEPKTFPKWGIFQVTS